MAEPAAACEEVVQVYRTASGPVAALRGIDTAFERGTVTVVVGPSGAGKSTLLRLLACLEGPAAGEVWIGGEATAHLTPTARRHFAAQRVGYVFQQPRKNLLDYLTAAEHVHLAATMRSRGGPTGAELDLTGLTGAGARLPAQLSAGEQQRLAFAMAVAGEPALVVADEPTAELDPEETMLLVACLPSLRAAGQTIVVSSHDASLIAAADRVLVVSDGCLAASGPPGATLSSVVDRAGRIQLPGEVVAALAGRARLTMAGDGDGLRVVVEPVAMEDEGM